LQYPILQNHNVILSSELFGSQMRINYKHVWDRLNKLLIGYEPIIIIGYRHFHDWIPSNYFQKSAVNGIQLQSIPYYIENYLNEWNIIQNNYYYEHNGNNNNNNNGNGNCNGNGNDNDNDNDNGNGNKQNNIIIDNDIDNVESSGLNSQSHITLWLYQKWLQHFDSKSIRIFDMHQYGYIGLNHSHGSSSMMTTISNSSSNSNSNSNSNSTDLATAFICQMIPTAYKTCQMLQQQQISTNENNTNSNNSDSDSNAHLERAMNTLRRKKLQPSSSTTTNSNSNSNSNNNTRNGDGDGNSNSSSGSTTSTLLLRQSKDLYPQRIIEFLNQQGLIESKKFGRWELQKYITKIHEILENNNIIPYKIKITNNNNTSTPSGSGSGGDDDDNDNQNQNQNYHFDCISSQLEKRLYNTSLYFMERIYNTTTITAAVAVAPSSSSSNISYNEWNNIRNKHYNLFQKNINNGKYCDINPKRILLDDNIKSQIMKVFLYKSNYMYSIK
jgi:hypothetical protein